MTTQEPASAGTVQPTARPRSWDLGELMESFWSDRLWPRRMLAGFDGILKIEESIEDGRLVVRAEIPGVDPDKDVDISVDDGVLRITATRQSEQKDTDEGRFRTEFHYGRMAREIRLPKNTDIDQLTATYKDGVVEISAPVKGEESGGARKIELNRP
jgi:HSP20 family protein